ncbi:uncharacterized protein LOC8023346 isoform X4 [Ixodes scapularis]|nr:uncharacterized protein LOC8023346 isoform X4 [Ixodes scapularis]
MCFVNSHLAAHESETFQRVTEYNIIIEKQRFVDAQATNILTHDYAFWFGDLNFRVDDCTMEEMKASIENGTFDQMLQKDQLNRVRSKGEAFHEFMEHEVTFPPTYKFQIDRMGYNFSHRKPAWTDRILFRFTKNAYENVALDLKQHQYVSHDLYIQSDHKPVSGFFSLKVFAKPLQPMIHFLPVGTWIINQDSFAWYYTSADTELKSWDWIGLYRENFNSLEDHLGYVWASTRPTDVYPTHLRYRRSRSRSSRGSQSRLSPVNAVSPTPGTGSGVREGSLRSSPNLDALSRSQSLGRPHKVDDTPDDLVAHSDDEHRRRPSAKESVVMASATTVTTVASTTKAPGGSTDRSRVKGSFAAGGSSKKRPDAMVTWKQGAQASPSTYNSLDEAAEATGVGSTGTPTPEVGNASPFENKTGSDQEEEVPESPLARAPPQCAPSETPQGQPRESLTGQAPRVPPCPPDKVFYRVLFGDQTLLVSGRYRLVYLRGQSDVLGMSEPFKFINNVEVDSQGAVSISRLSTAFKLSVESSCFIVGKKGLANNTFSLAPWLARWTKAELHGVSTLLHGFMQSMMLHVRMLVLLVYSLIFICRDNNKSLQFLARNLLHVFICN